MEDDIQHVRITYRGCMEDDIQHVRITYRGCMEDDIQHVRITYRGCMEDDKQQVRITDRGHMENGRDAQVYIARINILFIIPNQDAAMHVVKSTKYISTYKVLFKILFLQVDPKTKITQMSNSVSVIPMPLTTTIQMSHNL